MKKLAICLVAVLALSLFGSCAEDELQQLDYSCEGLYAEEVKRFQIAEIPFGEDYEAAISESVSYELSPSSPEPDLDNPERLEVYVVSNPATFMGEPVTVQFTVRAETGMPAAVALLYHDDDADEMLEFYNQIVDEMLELYGLPRMTPTGGVEQRDGSLMQWFAYENYGFAPADLDVMAELGAQADSLAALSEALGNQTNAAVRIMEYADVGDCVVITVSE